LFKDWKQKGRVEEEEDSGGGGETGASITTGWRVPVDKAKSGKRWRGRGLGQDRIVRNMTLSSP